MDLTEYANQLIMALVQDIKMVGIAYKAITDEAKCDASLNPEKAKMLYIQGLRMAFQSAASGIIQATQSKIAEGNGSNG